MVMLTVADTVAPSAVVPVMVMVEGPVGVGAGPEADVHPTSAPAARSSRASVRYMGTRRNCAARCRTAPNIPSIEHNRCQEPQSCCGPRTSSTELWKRQRRSAAFSGHGIDGNDCRCRAAHRVVRNG